jgi:hypothetical protein
LEKRGDRFGQRIAGAVKLREMPARGRVGQKRHGLIE